MLNKDPEYLHPRKNFRFKECHATNSQTTSRRKLNPFTAFVLFSFINSIACRSLINGNYKDFCDEIYQDSSIVHRGYQILIPSTNNSSATKYLLINDVNNFNECVKQCCLNEFKCDVAFFNHQMKVCFHVVCQLSSGKKSTYLDNGQYDSDRDQQCPLVKKDDSQPTSLLQIRSPTLKQSKLEYQNELTKEQLIEKFGFLAINEISRNDLILKSKYSRYSNGGQVRSNQIGNLTVIVDKNPIIQLPNDSISIKAYVDPPSNQYSYKCTLISKPQAQQDSSFEPDTDSLKLNKLIQGTYIFNLTVSTPSSSGPSGQATVNITVLPPKRINKPPTAFVQPNNSTVQLPKKEIVLDGSQSVDDDKIVSYKWDLLKAPIGFELPANDIQTSTLQLKNLIAGSYVFQLTVTDSDNQTSSAQANLIVLKEKDYPPVANAGEDQIIFLPQNSVTLNGNLSTDDKGIVSYEWTLDDNENGANKPMNNMDMNGVKTPYLHLSNLEVGVYKFILKVTDSSNQVSTAETHVFVKPTIDIKPEANAGTPVHKVYMPLKQNLTLDGSKSKDVSGIVKYNWTQISGPRKSVILDPFNSTTNVTGLVPGVFVFNLEVTNAKNLSSNASTSVEVVQISNLRPIVLIEGGNKTIFCSTPCDIVLNGSKSYDDLIDLKYHWTRETNSLAIGEAIEESDKSPILKLANLIQGKYVFRLTVEDNQGAKSSDLVWIDIKETESVKELVEVLLNADYKQFRYEQENAVLKKLDILLSSNIDETVQISDVKLFPVYESNLVLLKFRVQKIVNGKEESLPAIEVARRLRLRLRNDKSLNEILSVRTATCQNTCSGHGKCVEKDKTCKCDFFWMQNVLRFHFGDMQENCDFSVLYFFIFSVFAFCLFSILLYSTICCLFRRKPMHLRLIKPHLMRRVDLLKKTRKPRSKYTLLKQTKSNGFGNKINNQHSSDESDLEVDHRSKRKMSINGSTETKIKKKSGNKQNYKVSSSDSDVIEFDFDTISKRGFS